MLFVFICNLICYLWISIYKIKYISGYFKGRGFLNPFVLVFLIQLPIELSKIFVGPSLLLDNGIFNIYYNYALFTTNLALLADLALTIIALKVSMRYKVVLGIFKFKVNEKRMLVGSAVFYFLYVVFFVLLSASSFGVLNWIAHPREGYQLHRNGAGQYWVFAISFLSVSFTLACLYIKKYSVIFSLFFLFAVSSYMLGSKGIMLNFFILLFIVLWLRDYRHMKLIYMIGLPLAFLIILVNFISTTQGAGLVEIFSYFDHYVNSATYFEAYFHNQIPLFYGKIYLSDFWGVVPRSLVHTKPYVYGIIMVNDYFWPGAAELTNTPAFGGPIPYFADFGLAGVVVMTLLNPFQFIYYFFLGQLLKNFNYRDIKRDSMVCCLFILFQSPNFLTSLGFPANMIFYLIVVAMMMFLNRLSARSNKSVSHPV